MKKLLILTLTVITAAGLNGCSTARVEKEPVVVEDTKEDTLEDIAADDTANSKTSESADNAELQIAEEKEANSAEDNTLSDTIENTAVSEEPFEYTIELEGMEETINCKTFQSALGYQIFYDIDRFKVTSEDGVDSFMAENPDPELYPYVYLNISRTEYPSAVETIDSSDSQWEKVVDKSGKMVGYVSKSFTKVVMDDKNNIVGYLNGDNSDPVDLENVKIGDYDAYHYSVKEGNEWNSAVRNYYFIKTDHYVYSFETQYFLEAAEGFGARILAMMDTFQLQ